MVPPSPNPARWPQADVTSPPINPSSASPPAPPTASPSNGRPVAIPSSPTSPTAASSPSPNPPPHPPPHPHPAPNPPHRIPGSPRHHDAPYDDIARQPGLTRNPSQPGPALAWWDADADGWEDLFVSGGTDSTPFFIPFTNGIPNPARAVTGFPKGDNPGWVALSTEPNHPRLLSGLSGYESDSIHSARLFPVVAGLTLSNAFPNLPASITTLAATDLDGSGSLTLFTGGGPLPGRHPLATPSILWRHSNSTWQPVPNPSPLLSQLGPVNAARFIDLDHDGQSELVVAADWAPIRILKFSNSQCSDVTADWGLAHLSGWWRSLAVGDFNHDGLPDLIAGNWGLNSTHRPTAEHPVRLFAGDVDGNGLFTLLETHWDDALQQDVPWRTRDALSLQFPWLSETFPTRANFAAANARSILGDRFPKTRAFAITTTESVLLLNQGSRFKSIPLPAPAQWAPIPSIAVADANGDGHDDVFLSQNHLALTPDEVRQDAGRGLWLQGDGRGGFSPLPPGTSGISLAGDLRGAAVGDFDHDGRIDLAVGQNHGPVTLFHNRIAPVGLRIRLIGPPGNPLALGASLTVRRVAGNDPHPVTRWIPNAGGSLSSLSTIVPKPTHPSHVAVTWPGGRTTSIPVPPDSTSLVIRWQP